jgi:hypothetical protein
MNAPVFLISLCTSLIELDADRVLSKLSIYKRPSHTCFFSNLPVLTVIVANFYDAYVN